MRSGDAAERGDSARRDPRAGAAEWSADAGDDEDGAEVDVPLAMASDEERLAGKSFDRLEPHELAQLYRLMTRLRVGGADAAQPARYEKGALASVIDMRWTLRASLLTGGARSASPAAAGASPTAGSWCCATSPARWSPTRAPTCSS